MTYRTVTGLPIDLALPMPRKENPMTLTEQTVIEMAAQGHNPDRIAEYCALSIPQVMRLINRPRPTHDGRRGAHMAAAMMKATEANASE